MNCSDCSHLDSDKKKCGALCGAKYYCKKIDKYVDGSCPCCEHYDKSYRSNYLKDEIYKDGYNYSDDTRPISFYISLLIIIIFAGTLLSLIDTSAIL